MTTLDNYVKENRFGGEGFPEGKTLIDTTKAEIEEITVDFEGKPRKRYVIKYDGKAYWAGNKIMSGIKEEVEKGNTQLVIIRQGTGLKTTYVVLPYEK